MITLRDRLYVATDIVTADKITGTTPYNMTYWEYNGIVYFEVEDFYQPWEIDDIVASFWDNGLAVDGYLVYDLDGYIYRTEYVEGKPVTHNLEWVFDLDIKTLEEMEKTYDK
jgi:hypothetical protein